MLALAVALALSGCGGTVSRRQGENPPYTEQAQEAAKKADPYERRGYSMDDKPTERQVQITRDLIEEANYRDSGADRVLAGEGWPSWRLFDFITHAETALDRMRERYGVAFRALNGGYVLPGVGYPYYEFRMAATEGPLAGRECRYRYLSPDQAKGPAEESDTYIDLLRHDEYVAYVFTAIDRAFAEHPGMHGAADVTSTGNDGLWAEMPDPKAPLKELLPHLASGIDIYISPASKVDREEYDAFNKSLGEELAGLKTDTSYELVYINRVTDPYKDKPFSFAAGYAARVAANSDESYIKWDQYVSVHRSGEVTWDDNE